MRRFMKIFAFLMLGLGLAAAPGYWTYVNFLSAKTVSDQLIFGDETSRKRAETSGHMSVHLTPAMNPIQILARLEVAPPEGQPLGSTPNLHVAVRSGDQQIWAAAVALWPEFNTATGAELPITIGVNLGTLYVLEPGDYSVRGSVDRTDRLQVQRIYLEVRRDVIDIRWGFFGVGILLILGALILYRVAES